MSWEHNFAKELKKRDNSAYPDFMIGKVLSPVEETAGGVTSYIGPLIISIFDGQIRLEKENLILLDHLPQLHDGQTVALLGRQKFIVLGVVT